MRRREKSCTAENRTRAVQSIAIPTQISRFPKTKETGVNLAARSTFSWSAKLLLAFASTAILGFRLLEIHD
jgi:hypothetical protein